MGHSVMGYAAPLSPNGPRQHESTLHLEPTVTTRSTEDASSETLQVLKVDRLTDPLIAAGDRSYLVGLQDGSFPDMGWHVEGEMGGIWAHPVKLLDGIWMSVDDVWLKEAISFESQSFWNEHRFKGEHGLEVRRRQFAPDGHPAVVLRFVFRSPTDRTVTLRLVARTDLQSVWPVDTDRLERATDRVEYHEDLGAWLAQGAEDPWTTLVGAAAQPSGHEGGPHVIGPETTMGNGVAVALDYQLHLVADTDLTFDVVVAGGEGTAEAARQTYGIVRNGIDRLWQEKAERYHVMLQRSRLALPEPAVMETWDWTKCTLDWLVRDVPGVGRGLGAGVDDYVWWFGCDNGFALLGCLALGQHDTAIDTLDLLRKLSIQANGNSGRVLHEANTRGTTTNRGNTQESPQFVQTVWQTFLWTGDGAFLERNYTFCRSGLLDWTLGEKCDENDVLPYGYGITEQEGLNLQCVDTAVHSAEALEALSGMAEVLGDVDTVNRCRRLRPAVLRRIEDFWIEEEGLYGDMLATPAEMVPRLRTWLTQREALIGGAGWEGALPEAVDALRRLLIGAESAAEPQRKRSWYLANWSIVAPLIFGLADEQRGNRMLERMETSEFTGKWGIYLSGFDRTHAMSISTGAVAEAEMRYGRVAQGMNYIRLLAETVHLRTPGAISEMSPDYGCFVQAWSAYAVAWPIVACLFGVQPHAHLRRLNLQPCFPAGWDNVRLENLRVGNADFDLFWNGRELCVRCSQPGWTVTCESLPLKIEMHA